MGFHIPACRGAEMMMAELFVICSEYVRRLVEIGGYRLYQLVEPRSAGIIREFIIGIHPVGEIRGTAGISVLTEPVSEVAGKPEAVYGLYYELSGVAEVGAVALIDIIVVANDGMAAVTHTVALVGNRIYPGAVRILEGVV